VSAADDRIVIRVRFIVAEEKIIRTVQLWTSMFRVIERERGTHSAVICSGYEARQPAPNAAISDIFQGAIYIRDPLISRCSE
jgi:hypothetical protein